MSGADKVLPALSADADADAGAGAAVVERSGSVQVLEKAGKVLDCFSADNPAMRITDIRERTGLPATTCLRIVRTLVEQDLLQREGDVYRIGLRVLVWGAAATAGSVLLAAAGPVVRRVRDDKEVVPAEEFVAKLHATQEARTDDNLLIIARTDALAPRGFDEALRRAKRYEQAGADVIFVEAPQTMEQIRRIPAEFDVPCLFNDVPRGHSPAVDHATLGRFGYRLIIAPVLCMGAAGVAIGAALQALRADEHNGDRVPQLSPKELFDALGLAFWENLRQRHELPSGDAAGVRG